MPTALLNNTVTTAVLYMAMELSQNKWVLAFGTGAKKRQVTVDTGDRVGLLEELKKAKIKLGLGEEAEVRSCYEAGRDGFWIHRWLMSEGIKNIVIDSSSIRVSRKRRHAKSDRLDVDKLLKQLIHHERGEEKLAVARVPSKEEEDRRRMHRERERLKKERTGHTNRIKGLLILFGIKYKNKGRISWEAYLEQQRDWEEKELPVYQKEELLRETKRLELVESQLKQLELQMLERLKTSDEDVYKKIHQLKHLKGIGDVSSWILIMEWFGWRNFKNRREVGAAAGLVGTPYDSGESQREQGISKAGNHRIRALMLELAWLWVRYQPTSDLTQWFLERFGQGKRIRKIGIVALARRLLIAIWRYVETGEIPKGAQLKSL